MFFDTANMMMQKQKISEYLVKKINILKFNPALKLQNFIVQVISIDQVSDGTTNFHAKFRKIYSNTNNNNLNTNTTPQTSTQVKKGSYIRMLEWTIDLATFDIVIRDYQYLGGAGYNVRCGKPWDIEKLKMISNSSIVSNDFMVLYNPNPSTHPPQTPITPAAKLFKMPCKRQRCNINSFIYSAIHGNEGRRGKGYEKKEDSGAMRYKVRYSLSNKNIIHREPSPNNFSTPNIRNIHIENKNFASSDMDYKFCQKQIKKMRIPRQLNEEEALSRLSIKDLLGGGRECQKPKRLDARVGHIELDGRDNNFKPTGDNDEDIPSHYSTQHHIYIKQDSKGRSLVFNKEEIKKLLGKQ